MLNESSRCREIATCEPFDAEVIAKCNVYTLSLWPTRCSVCTVCLLHSFIVIFHYLVVWYRCYRLREYKDECKVQLQGAAKKVAPKVFLPFSRQLFGVLSNFFLQIYILIYYYLSAK